ncbi:hypothetical protein ACPB8Q_07995 (plasmid) [Methanocaldococcus indicus]|uniref:hypothetical protein n=1 Tax=Methanocaldococcus indicus TaxID=213231 RepID=UPI0039C906CF
MLKKFLLKYLELDDYKRIKENQETIIKKLSEFEENIISLREHIEKLENDVNNKIKKLENDVLTRKDLEDIQKQVETLNLLINGIINTSKIENIKKEHNMEIDDDKEKILNILYEKNEVNITELLNSVDMGAKKFYKLIKELKKEGKIQIIKKGRLKIVKLK